MANDRIERLPLNEMCAVLALFGNTTGSYCFVIGSFFFYPQIQSEPVGGLRCRIATDWNLLDVGTHFFVLGSAMFVLSTIVNVFHALRKVSLLYGKEEITRGSVTNPAQLPAMRDHC